MRMKTEIVLFTLKFLSEMTFREKKNCFWPGALDQAAVFAVQSIVAQPYCS